MCYHLSRKPISVVKTVLNQNCSNLTPPADLPQDHISNWCDYAPFGKLLLGIALIFLFCIVVLDKSDASQLLGTLDSAFLFAYAVAMFASGFIAERVNLRYFLSLGMIFSGVFSYLFGIAKTYDIHNMGYFVVVQVSFFNFQLRKYYNCNLKQALAGIAQTTGWPGVVTVVGNWFGKSKRGLIFGIWNSHTSIGNIMGLF